MPPAPMPQQQPPNGAANNTQAAYQAAVLQKLAQGSSMAGAAAQAALNGAVAGQPLGQPHVPLAPGVVPPSTDAIKNAIEMGQSAKGFPLKLPQGRKQSQSAPGTSGTPSLPTGQPSTNGQPNRNPVPHPSATPVSSHASLGPQSRAVGVSTIPLQNGNQTAANSVANFHGQNSQAPPIQQMVPNPQFATVLGRNPMAGSVARPTSAAQGHPPNGQMQPPQAGRVPQQVAQQGLVQHPQHAANPQLAAYLHAQLQQPHQPQGQPGGAQPAQPTQPQQVPPSPLTLLPIPVRNSFLQQKAQFSQLGPAEKQAWLDKWTDPQLRSHPDWHSKTDDDKVTLALNLKAKQFLYHQRLVYAQRMAGQVGQGMMANGMMVNGMVANGMITRMPGANPMVGMVGMPGAGMAGMAGMPGMMQNMGGMPLQNGMPGQQPPQ